MAVLRSYMGYGAPRITEPLLTGWAGDKNHRAVINTMDAALSKLPR
jgi:hypothetical protein